MFIWLVSALVWLGAIARWSRRPPEARTGAALAECVLQHTLVGCVGFLSLFFFAGHWFFADQTARLIGWPEGNPFQKEVALTSLSFACLGLLCARFRGGFWAATAIGASVFYLGAAYVHVMEMVTKANYHPWNAGSPFYYDIVMPLILLGTLWVHVRAKA